MNKRTRKLFVWTISISMFALVATAYAVVAAPAESKAPQQTVVSSTPAELDDQGIAVSNPKAAPMIQKIQTLFKDNPLRGRLAAASGLNDPEADTRRYAARLLGAIGDDQQLAVLSRLQSEDSDPAVRSEAALAHVRIEFRLAGSDENNQLTVLLSAMGHNDVAVRRWAAHALAEKSSPKAKRAMDNALQTEKDATVQAALQGK